MSRLGIALLVVGLWGCGSRRIDFPVDNTKVLSTVSAGELQSMCNSVISYSKDAFHAACLTKGLSVLFKPGGTPQSCQAAVDACIAEFQSKPISCGLMDPKQMEGCNATVGEYETCLNDSLALLDKLESKLSCSMSLSDLQDLAKEMESLQSMPPSCKTFAQKCPKLMGG